MVGEALENGSETAVAQHRNLSSCKNRISAEHHRWSRQKIKMILCDRQEKNRAPSLAGQAGGARNEAQDFQSDVRELLAQVCSVCIYLYSFS